MDNLFKSEDINLTYKVESDKELKFAKGRFNAVEFEIKNSKVSVGYFSLNDDNLYNIYFAISGVLDNGATKATDIKLTASFFFDQEEVFKVVLNVSVSDHTFGHRETIFLKLNASKGIQEIKFPTITKLGRENNENPFLRDTNYTGNFRPSEFDNKERGFQSIKPDLSAIVEKRRFNIHRSQLSPAKEEDSGGLVTLFFGTNRQELSQSGVNDRFGSELSEILTVGKCTVNIPPRHKQGVIERPGKFLFIQLDEYMSKHVVIQDIKNLSDEDFSTFLKSSLSISDEKSALIFIHGYNNSFSEAAWRTAQIAYDLPFPGITGFFSWPSSAKKLDYPGDEARAVASKSALAEFLTKIIVNGGISKLHVIAHSMGSLLFTQVACDLLQEPSFKNRLNVFNQLILAAPDIDADVFKNTILPKFRSVGQRRTVYASAKDLALFLSKGLRGGRPRVGDAGGKIFIDQNIDTIDASNVEVINSTHSYMFESVELLYDLNLLITQGLDPLNRRLRVVPEYKGPVYTFRQ